jgi:hypothetical protein
MIFQKNFMGLYYSPRISHIEFYFGKHAAFFALACHTYRISETETKTPLTTGGMETYHCGVQAR